MLSNPTTKSIPGEFDLIALKHHLCAGDDRQWAGPPMGDEVAGMVSVSMNLTNDVRWQNQQGVPDKAETGRRRHIAKISHLNQVKCTFELNKVNYQP